MALFWLLVCLFFCLSVSLLLFRVHMSPAIQAAAIKLHCRHRFNSILLSPRLGWIRFGFGLLRFAPFRSCCSSFCCSFFRCCSSSMLFAFFRSSAMANANRNGNGNAKANSNANGYGNCERQGEGRGGNGGVECEA